LVKLLAVSPRKRLTRDELIEALWPGVPPEAGGTNARKAVHFARRALGGEGAIGAVGGWIELWPGRELDTDVDDFQDASERAISVGAQDAFRAAVGLYGGELLPEDRAEPWSEGPRRALKETYVRLLRGAAMWDQIIELDPTDEEAHRELIRAHLGAGNRQASIRQFE